MIHFFAINLDYLLLASGMCLFLISASSLLLIEKNIYPHFWERLALSGLFFGIFILFELFTLESRYVNSYTILKLVTSAIALISLFDYGRLQTAKRTKNKKLFGFWFYLIPLFFAVFYVLFSHGNVVYSLNIFVRYFFGLGGGLWCSYVILTNTEYKAESANVRWSYIFVAILIALLSLTHIFNAKSIQIHLIRTVIIFFMLILILFGFKLANLKIRTRLQVAAAFIALLILSFFTITRLGSLAREHITQTLSEKIKTTATLIDYRRISTLKGSLQDVGKPDFNSLKDVLVQTRLMSKDCRFTYLIGKRDNKIFFYMDSEPPTSKDYAAPGSTWEKYPPGILAVFSKGVDVIEGPYTDEWGTWVSGFSPIKDPKMGKIVAVFGLDISAVAWKDYILEERTSGSLIMMALFFVFFMLLLLTASKKIAVDAIQERDLELKNFLDNVDVGIYIMDTNMRILSVNRKIRKMLPHGQLDGNPICYESFNTPPLSGPCPNCPTVKTLQDRKVHRDIVDVCRGGNLLKCNVISSLIKTSDGQIRLVTFAEDVTSKFKIEEALRASETRYKTIFESSHDANMLLDVERNYRTGNTAALKLFKCKDNEEFRSKTILDLSPEYQSDGILSSVKSKQLIEIAMEHGSVFFEWTYKKMNGEEFFATVSLTKMELDGRQLLQATVHDISDRKKMEQEIIKISKIKDEFLSITSHDLKSPLGIVKTSMSLLLEEENLTPAIKEYAELSLRQSNKGLKLISDLLDLKKLETGDVKLEPTKFKFTKLVEEIMQDFRQSYGQAGISLEAFSDNDYEIIADYDKVGQLISNLLGNALKYTSRGGSVKITTSLNEEKDFLKVTVSDTGSGIPEDKVTKIFEKYEQASSSDKKKGTGIGLSIVKYVCELHHGKVWVESKMGQGSNFIFTLPYTKEAQQFGNKKDLCSLKKILIVDDMEDQRFTTKALLKKGNLYCDEASSCKEALDKIKTNNFSLILLDIEMPEKNGYELLEIIRRDKTAKELPVIMFSSKKPDDELCKKLGVSCFVRKEQAVTSLVPEIKKVLEIE